jgi:hypothetical protein
MTGQEKTRKKLGGAYPGQRRPPNQPYLPPASEFGKDGQAVAHFVAFGGGNALTLVWSSEAQSVSRYVTCFVIGFAGRAGVAQHFSFTITPTTTMQSFTSR